MVYKCAAINCRSGYRGEKQDQKVTFHSFLLEDKRLLQTWLKRLARKDCVPTKHSKLCSLHHSANIFKLINSFLLESDNEQQISILKFFMEQIDLAFSNKYSRKYSSDLLMMAFVIFATNPRAYERLVEEKIPSIKTLKKITLNLDSKTGISDKQYLTLRFSQLNAFDRNVNMMIDEIYLAKRVEASGGQLFGLTDHCQVATTGLCFMIKSLSSSYQDMIGIHSVKSLIAETQKKML